MRRTFALYGESSPSRSFTERLTPGRLHKHRLDDFELESGDRVVNLTIAYRVFGRPSPERDNVVLVLHALTGDANCAGYEGPLGWTPGWWEPLFRPGAPLDTDRYCVICPNHPSSCYGSSGPLDREVGADAPLGLDFPDFTSRDLARVHRELLRALGLIRPALVIGGSLGGMIALEYAASFPEDARRVAVIAAPSAGSAQSLAFSHIQRKCFELDRHFNNGNYYDGPKPVLALSLARQIGMITYRNGGEFAERFGRRLRENADGRAGYEVESYLDYQGDKLMQRFDPNAYLKLLQVLDGHDIARNCGSVEAALQPVRSEMLFVSIDSDILYTPEEVRHLAEQAQAAGVNVHHETLKSIHGHDAFLIEYRQLHAILAAFLDPRTGETQRENSR